MGEILQLYADDIKGGMPPAQAYQKHVVNNKLKLSEEWGCGPMCTA